MAARKTAIGKGTMPQRWREKIRTSMLVNRLEACVEGKADMSGPQVSAALGLLKKTLPDMTESQMNLSGDLTVNILSYADSKSPK